MQCEDAALTEITSMALTMKLVRKGSHGNVKPGHADAREWRQVKPVAGSMKVG
jgi:hypothetical protein